MENYKVLLVKNRHLETERLLLRPVTLNDAQDMHAYASDEETTYYVFDRHKSITETKESIVSYFLEKPFGKYAIELKENKKMIGTIDIRKTGKTDRGELGYTLNKDYQGNGYMTEAGQALLKLSFDVLEFHTVFAMHDERNTASGKVMERLGMQKEGMLRRVGKWKNGEYYNHVYYSILKEEYKSNC